MGTSLYLGVITASSLFMFGLEPGAGQMLMAMGLAVMTAFGAPGTPSSTIIFLDPVLAKAGLAKAQAEEIFKMIIPADRLFDMGQTALNVWGDMMVALDTRAGLRGKGIGATFARVASLPLRPVMNLITKKQATDPRPVSVKKDDDLPRLPPPSGP